MKRITELPVWLAVNQERDLITLVLGLRGSGKTWTLVDSRKFLTLAGVPPENVVYMNFDDPALRHFRAGEQVADYVLSRLSERKGRCYVLLDEVSCVMRFEKIFEALDGQEHRIDICASASSRRLLSDEMAEKFRGRFRIVEYRPDTYYEWSGFTKAQASVKNYLSRDAQGVRWNAALVRDVLGDRLAEAGLMEGIVGYFYDTIGEPQSLRKIAAAVAPGRSLSANTVESYVRRLEDAFIVERAHRWDVLAGREVKAGDHFYFLDPALPYGRFGAGNEAALLKNLVWQELRSRRANVYAGRIGVRGVDFVVPDRCSPSYWQTASSAEVMDETSRERLVASFNQLLPSGRKFVITYDRPPVSEMLGVRFIGLNDLPDASGS